MNKILVLLTFLLFCSSSYAQTKLVIPVPQIDELQKQVLANTKEIDSLKSDLEKSIELNKQLIYVDSFEGSDDEKVKQAIAEAKRRLTLPSNSNKNQTIWFAPRAYQNYDRSVYQFGSITPCSLGDGIRSTRLICRNVKSDETLFQCTSVHGGTVKGFSIVGIKANDDVEGVTGVRLQDCGSMTFERCEILMDNAGKNTTGLILHRKNRWNESNRIEKLNIRAGTGIDILNGDNLVFRDLDISCTAQVVDGDHIWTAVKVAIPWNYTFDNISTQGGHHAFYMDTTFQSGKRNVGNQLVLRSWRAEQLVQNEGKAAFVLKVVRTISNSKVHGFETLMIDSCRSSKQDYALDIEGCLKDPVIQASFLQSIKSTHKPEVLENE